MPFQIPKERIMTTDQHKDIATYRLNQPRGLVKIYHVCNKVPGSDKCLYYRVPWIILAPEIECVRTALQCTAFGCTVFGCTVFGCTALHCTALHCTASSFLILADHLKDWCNILLWADSLLSINQIRNYLSSKKIASTYPHLNTALHQFVLCCNETMYIKSRPLRSQGLLYKQPRH